MRPPGCRRAASEVRHGRADAVSIHKRLRILAHLRKPDNRQEPPGIHQYVASTHFRFTDTRTDPRLPTDAQMEQARQPTAAAMRGK